MGEVSVFEFGVIRVKQCMHLLPDRFVETTARRVVWKVLRQLGKHLETNPNLIVRVFLC